MKDPTRLLDDGATANERRLLQAGDAEEPPPDGRKRLAAALGVSVGTTAGTAATGVKAAGLATDLVTRGALKWILVVAGSAALGGAVVLMTTRPRAPVPSAAQAPPSEPVREPRTETREPPPRDEAVAEPRPVQPEKEHPPSAEPVAEPSGPPGAKSIAGEIAALDKARRALAQGQALAALSELNEYDEGYADGTLKQEGILLRIEALAKAGELPTARKLAGSFLRDHPGSPHEKRVRTLIGEAR